MIPPKLSANDLTAAICGGFFFSLVPRYLTLTAIPWRIIKDTRNFYVHSYGAIDVRAVWDTLEQDIPALKAACEAILSA